jgi:thioredoxin reductase (NADPH)
VDVDMTAIGAGPVGLYAAYYAGFRGMRTAIVDSLPEPGGQISALYPEKLIYDIAGFPQVRGRDLVSGLVDQAEKFGPEWLLGHSADGLEHLDGGRLRITTRQGAAVSTGALVIAGGIGTFSPRPLPAGAALLGRGLDYFVTAPDEYAGQDVLVVGGGDSAVDWALTLEPIAKSVTLVHRRPQFTAHAGSVTQLRASRCGCSPRTWCTRWSARPPCSARWCGTPAAASWTSWTAPGWSPRWASPRTSAR